MIFPVKKLLADRGKPVCIHKNETVRDALVKMVTHDYSQLPIVDDDGYLQGIISDRAIARTMYHVDGKERILHLTVDHCQEPAAVLAAESDVTEALDALQHKYALIIVENKKPIGIITDYDSTHFFRHLYEGLLLVEDIEVMLRQMIESICGDPNLLKQVLINLVGVRKDDDTQPNKEFETLTFGQYMNIINHPKNWHLFEEFLKPEPLFTQYMDQVRNIRNHLAHFRGELEPIDYDILYRVRNWLENRPRPSEHTKITGVLDVTLDPLVLSATATAANQGKYTPLEVWLKAQGTHLAEGQSIQRLFSDIESLLGESLPEPAKQHRAWWDNDPINNPQSKAWLTAGWKVDNVNFGPQIVTFYRTDDVLYQVFFADILTRLKEKRPNITHATKVNPQPGFSFSGGRTGFAIGWGFNEGYLIIHIYINPGDRKTNEKAFNLLKEQTDELEKKLGHTIVWDPRPRTKTTSLHINLIEADITQPPEELEAIKTLAVDEMIKFVDTFQPRIKELPL